jgi:hypothetical protein
LLDDLKKIEKAFPMEREQPGKRGEANPSDSGKHKIVLIHEPIPKKPCTNTKHCTLCKNMGACIRLTTDRTVASTTKNGKIKKSFGKGQHGSTASDKKTASTFAQLSVKITKLKKVNEKIKKSLQKRKGNYDSGSDDSNSS